MGRLGTRVSRLECVKRSNSSSNIRTGQLSLGRAQSSQAAACQAAGAPPARAARAGSETGC
eukprot:364715-Chlamydomonas_euryale.AAC.1